MSCFPERSLPLLQGPENQSRKGLLPSPPYPPKAGGLWVLQEAVVLPALQVFEIQRPPPTAEKGFLMSDKHPTFSCCILY